MDTKTIFGVLLSLLNKQKVNTAKWNIIYKHNPTPLLALLDKRNTICCIEQIDNTLVFDDDGTNFDYLSGNIDKLKTIALDQDLDVENNILRSELPCNSSNDEIKSAIQAFVDAYLASK